MQAPPKKKIRRSRLGCHRCKRLKIKCTEERPACAACLKGNVQCDYSLKLTWGGRPFKNKKGSKSPNSEFVLPQTASPLGTLTFVSGYDGASTSSMGKAHANAASWPMAKSESEPMPKTQPMPQFLSLNNTPNPIKVKTEDVGGPNLGDFAIPRSPTLSQMLDKDLASASRALDSFNQSHGQVSLRNSELLTSLIDGQQDTLENYPMSENQVLVNAKNESDLKILNNVESGRLNGHKDIRIQDLVYSAKTSPEVQARTPSDFHLSETLDSQDPYAKDIACIESLIPEQPRSPYFSDFLSSFPKSPGVLPNRSPESLSYEEEVTRSIPNETSVQDPENMSEEDHAMAVLNSIPPALMPLPEILLNVPYYRQLLHFWINVASNNLVPAPSHIYRDNPFKVILPQMAMHYDGILTTILAFSAKVRQSLDPNGVSQQPIIDQLLGRSCNELLRQLQDKNEATSDSTLAIILLLSGYETVSSNDFEKHRTHNIGASEIVSARVSKMVGTANEDSTGAQILSCFSLSHLRDESDIAYFLMRWFAYMDILGALAATKGRDKYLRAYKNRGKYSPIQNVFANDSNGTSSTDPKRDIDYFVGFDTKLFRHFVNISLLIDEVNRYLAEPDARADAIPLYIIANGLEIKLQLMKDYEYGEERRSTIMDELIEAKLKFKKPPSPTSSKNVKDLVHDDNILRATNKVFFDAALMNLYRRVFRLPRSSTIVQDLATEMAEILEYGIELTSPAEICSIFCHFCAGCETLDPEKRQFYFNRFSKLSIAGNINAMKSLLIMQRCWDTGEDWLTAANVLDIDVVLL